MTARWQSLNKKKYYVLYYMSKENIYMYEYHNGGGSFGKCDIQTAIGKMIKMVKSAKLIDKCHYVRTF